jgi:hypothetical protein
MARGFNSGPVGLLLSAFGRKPCPLALSRALLVLAVPDLLLALAACHTGLRSPTAPWPWLEAEQVGWALM